MPCGVMGVLRPLCVVIENYPEGQVDELEAVNNPEDPAAGSRKVPFSRILYVEQDDFQENPPKDFFRLAPGREVRRATPISSNAPAWLKTRRLAR